MSSRPPHQPSPRDDDRKGERIAKLLARAGVASRREVERMIAEGRVARDGVAIDTPATVLTSLHGITVDGNPVAAAAPARLFAYHKPPGLLVTERDPAGRPTIYDRLPKQLPRVVPVGRLDLATEGLLLMTTDGGLKRQLELPATGVERTYRARAYGPISQAQLEELIHGIEIDGIRYGSIDANLERRTGANTWIELTLAEGKNREVRRVLEYLGLEVSRLIRTRYGPFMLGDMPPGAVGEVRQHDLVAFRQSLKGSKGGDKDMRVMALPLPEVMPEGDGEPGAGKPRATRPPRSPDVRHDRAAPRADRSPRVPGAGGVPAPPARDERPRRSGTPPRGNATFRQRAPDQRAERTPAVEGIRRGAGRPGAPQRRDDPPADRAAERPIRRPEPGARPPRDGTGPGRDRTKGPAGGRGKPQDPRRPKTPPRGKR